MPHHDRESTDFDFDAIDDALAAPAASPRTNARREPAERLYTEAEMAHALAEYARWLIYGSTRSLHRGGKRSAAGPQLTPSSANHTLPRLVRGDLVAKRGIASAWMLAPSLFQGRSLAFIGRLPEVKLSRRVLSMHAGDFEATFGIKARGKRTLSNRAQLSASALKRWKKAKAAISQGCPSSDTVARN